MYLMFRNRQLFLQKIHFFLSSALMVNLSNMAEATAEPNRLSIHSGAEDHIYQQLKQQIQGLFQIRNPKR